MAVKRYGLGKGLNALLAGSRPRENETGVLGKTDLLQPNQVNGLPIYQVTPGPFQPRQSIRAEEIDALADSICSQGMVQPIVVRAVGADRYEIIAGERRWRAAQKAGLTTIPAVIKAVSAQDALAIALIENIQRADLTPLEEARAFERLAQEFRLTHEAIAKAVGKSRSTVTNLLRLLGLSEEVKQLLENGKIELGHAKVLMALSGELQGQVANRIIEKGLSVRETECLVGGIEKKIKDEVPTINKKVPALHPKLMHAQTFLSEALGIQVKISQRGAKKGRVVIPYNSPEELDRLLSHVC